MSQLPFSREHLEAYLDEALAPEEMACVEQTLRTHPQLRQELAAIVASRDRGVHTLGAIWRRNRITCPSRQQLQLYLEQKLEEPWAQYVKFHLQMIGCRYCQANLEDLKTKDSSALEAQERRRRFFHTSVGHLSASGPDSS